MCCVSAAIETETVKKFYTKVADAYGCLGVLNLGGCTCVVFIMFCV